MFTQLFVLPVLFFTVLLLRVESVVFDVNNFRVLEKIFIQQLIYFHPWAAEMFSNLGVMTNNMG